MDVIIGIFSVIILIVSSIFQWIENSLDDYFFQPEIKEPILIIIPIDAYLSSNRNYEHPNELFISSTLSCEKTEVYFRKGDSLIITDVVQISKIWQDTKYRYTVTVNNAFYEITTILKEGDTDKSINVPLLRSINRSVCTDSD